MAIVQALRERTAVALYRAARAASPAAVKRASRPLRSVDDGRGWWSIFSNHRNFQTSGDVEINRDSVFAQTTFFSCITLVAGDIGKLRAKLVQLVDGIWSEVASSAFSPVLRKPNRWQTWQQFAEAWIISKLGHGNAYILKQRDARGVVVALYVLDPMRCRPMVAMNGDVFYDLQADDLSRLPEGRTGEEAMPASEVIHDRFNCLFHPLVGLSPLFASGLAATQALEISKHSASFWKNSGRPGGILTAPGEISDETAARAKEYFEQNFTGENSGRIAVLADGLKFESMSMKSVDAQLVEQLKLSAEQVCAPFHVPAYMVGAAPVPPNNNIEALHLAYYSQCLQALIEAIENNLDAGLGLGPMSDGKTLGVELDLDGLLRMDTTALTTALSTGVRAGLIAPNEGRRRLSLPPVEGGNTPFLQHQDYPINLLANRQPPEAGGATAGAVRSVYLNAKGLPDMDPIRELIVAEVRAAMAAIPKARDGTDGKDGRDASFDYEAMRSEVQRAVAAIPKAVDGRDAAFDYEAMRSEIQRAVAALPKPADGRDGINGRDLDAQTANELVVRHVEARLGPLVEKGIEGRIETIATKAALQVPAGRDGLPGAPGRPGTPGEPGKDGRDAINGKDGRDGLSIDDFDVKLEENGRTITMSLRSSDGRIVKRELALAGMPLYRGVYASGKSYAKGDAVTYGGSIWIAHRSTLESPTGKNENWQLAVKGVR